MKLGKVLTGDATQENYIPTARNGASGVNKGREELEERKKTLWYEPVQALDKKSVLFLRPHRSEGTKAWGILRKKFKSFCKKQKLEKKPASQRRKISQNNSSGSQSLVKDQKLNTKSTSHSFKPQVINLSVN